MNTKFLSENVNERDQLVRKRYTHTHTQHGVTYYLQLFLYNVCYVVFAFLACNWLSATANHFNKLIPFNY
jgi:hypothetical protein